MTWDEKYTDKRILTLHPEIRERVELFINTVHSELGIKIRVTQANRSIPYQNELYAKGRTTPGRIITKVKGGYSYHNYGLAFDICIIKDGKADFKITQEIADLAIKMGFEWGGSWKNFKDKPHFQMTYGYTCSQLMNLKQTGKYKNL